MKYTLNYNWNTKTFLLALRVHTSKIILINFLPIFVIVNLLVNFHQIHKSVRKKLLIQAELKLLRSYFIDFEYALMIGLSTQTAKLTALSWLRINQSVKYPWTLYWYPLSQFLSHRLEIYSCFPSLFLITLFKLTNANFWCSQ